MIRQERILFEKILKTNRLHGLIREGDSVLLALSGGADSAAMAHLFGFLQKKYRLRLAVAHVHHGLGPQASRFEAAARHSAKALGIPFFVTRLNVRKVARTAGLGVEEAGRNARYRFFEAIARKHRYKQIATAHTCDDQAETLLFRLLRGTTFLGLSGIPYERPVGRVRCIRPLLDCTKKDLRLLVRALRLPCVEDASNRSSDYTRNRIRHALIPSLEKRYNPRLKEALASLQRSCLEAAPVIERETGRWLKKCLIRRTTKRVEIALAPFGLAPHFVRQELLGRIAEILGAGQGRLARAHADQIHRLTEGQGALTLHFPGFQAQRTGKMAVFFALRTD